MAVRKLVSYFASPKHKKRHDNNFQNIVTMCDIYEVKTLEEMPKALSYLINKVETLQQDVNNLRKKERASESPRSSMSRTAAKRSKRFCAVIRNIMRRARCSRIFARCVAPMAMARVVRILVRPVAAKALPCCS